MWFGIRVGVFRMSFEIMAWSLERRAPSTCTSTSYCQIIHDSHCMTTVPRDLCIFFYVWQGFLPHASVASLQVTRRTYPVFFGLTGPFYLPVTYKEGVLPSFATIMINKQVLPTLKAVYTQQNSLDLSNGLTFHHPLFWPIVP